MPVCVFICNIQPALLLHFIKFCTWFNNKAVHRYMRWCKRSHFFKGIFITWNVLPWYASHYINIYIAKTCFLQFIVTVTKFPVCVYTSKLLKLPVLCRLKPKAHPVYTCFFKHAYMAVCNCTWIGFYCKFCIFICIFHYRL